MYLAPFVKYDLSDLYIDLSDLYIDLSDPLVEKYRFSKTETLLKLYGNLELKFPV